MEDEEKIKESYGALIALLRWMDSYESLMVKAGIALDQSTYIALRSVRLILLFILKRIFIYQRVKSYMPLFLDHVKKLLNEYCERAIIKDRAEMQKLEAIAQMLKEKKELVSNFSEDIFHFVNQQLSLLVGKLNGELYIELIRVNLFNFNEIYFLKNTDYDL